MRLTKDEDYRTGTTRYVLEVNRHDLQLADFEWFDRQLAKDCELPGATIADKLLALEMLARRIQEGYDRAQAQMEANT